jgi:hypothetical protein
MMSQIRGVYPPQCHDSHARPCRTSFDAIGWPMVCIPVDVRDGRIRRGSRLCSVAAISGPHDCSVRGVIIAWRGKGQAGVSVGGMKICGRQFCFAQRFAKCRGDIGAGRGSAVSKIRVEVWGQGVPCAPSSISTVSIKTISARSKRGSARQPPRRSLGWLRPVRSKEAGGGSNQSAASCNLGARAGRCRPFAAYTADMPRFRRLVSAPCKRGRSRPCLPAQPLLEGLTTPILKASKSETLRVTTVRRCRYAVAAMKAPIIPSGWPFFVMVCGPPTRAFSTISPNFAFASATMSAWAHAAGRRFENHHGHNSHFRPNSQGPLSSRRCLSLMRVLGSHSGQSRSRRESFKENHRASELLLHPARATGAPGKKAIAREGRLIRGPSWQCRA